MLQHDSLGFDVWPSVQLAWQPPALTRPGCQSLAAYRRVQTRSAGPAPALNPHFPAGKAIRVSLAIHGGSSVMQLEEPLGGSQSVTQDRTCFWTKRLVLHPAFGTLKSELDLLVNTLQSHFWAGFHPSQFLCSGFHRQLSMISGQRYSG